MSLPIHAYVAVGERGLIKVGQTKNPKSRLASLKQDFKAHGENLSQIEFLPPIHCGWAVEIYLIYELRKIAVCHSGREWFTGIGFNEVLTMARERWEADKHRPVYKRQFTDEQLRQMADERRARLTESRERSRLERDKRAARQALKLHSNQPGRRSRAEVVFAAITRAITGEAGCLERLIGIPSPKRKAVA